MQSGVLKKHWWVQLSSMGVVQTILLCIAQVATQLISVTPNWILPVKMIFFFILPDLVLLISKTNVILMRHSIQITLHWVPLTTSSVITSTLIQRANNLVLS